MNRLSDTLVFPLLALLAALAMTITLVKITSDHVFSVQRTLDNQRTQLRDAQTRVQKSGSEKDLIVRYLPDYQKLSNLGFVGDEQRINWLDALRTVNQKVGLFGINYDISPRKAYPYAAALGAGQISVMHSVMKLRFQMLHEEDLVNFFASLYEQNAGVFTINRCSVRRTSVSVATRFQPNMMAECDVAWVTAQPPPAAEIGQ